MRKEVVVVGGSGMDSAMTRSLVLDMERRGFIVYVLVGSAREVEMVKREGRADVLPLRMDVMDVCLCFVLLFILLRQSGCRVSLENCAY